jgi:hypothetical protein
MVLVRYNNPITRHTEAMMMGYHNPTSLSPVYIVVSKVAINGVSPPNTPLPTWYGSDIEVYLIRVGNSSTRKAAIGPYTMVTKMICTKTSNTISQYSWVGNVTLPSVKKAELIS